MAHRKISTFEESLAMVTARLFGVNQPTAYFQHKLRKASRSLVFAAAEVEAA